MNKDNILRWYTGKGREKAAAALEMLKASKTEGSWVPGVSRKVKAALSKANVATKLGRRLREICKAVNEADHARRLLEDYKPGDSLRFEDRVDGHDLDMALTYGSPYTSRVDFAEVEAGLARVLDAEVKGIIAKGKAFCADFAEVDALIAELDATRPKPVFTELGVSPTVNATLKDLGLESTVAATARVCPIEWVREAQVNKKGETVYVLVGYLLWPEGTVHGRSRYHWSASNNRQCQACGHAIKNSYNWVPMIVDNAKGVPHSLWVGRDCALRIFGVKVTGEVELKDGPGAK